MRSTGDDRSGEEPDGTEPAREDVDPARPSRAGSTGDPTAAHDLLPLLYRELRQLAVARMARLGVGQTLQPTALVHEVFLRLAGKDADWDGRRHFFFAAARAMRDILVEQARAKSGPRRGGDRERQSLESVADVAAPDPDLSHDVLAVHEALAELEKLDPDKARLVLLRYFAGLTMAEVAEVTGESERTLHRHWRFARAWLQDRLAGN